MATCREHLGRGELTWQYPLEIQGFEATKWQFAPRRLRMSHAYVKFGKPC